ncbi:5-methyltetrahydropteroyltriglutamate--homocysteine S-methyltransferase [Aurantiacibacter flavus]|uniref:5-methyltetrahydropteroyltriglutamate--homocysteine S-methyltransferase n=1 Tax=Aurantiacibacter flavus TaxID=3145232 RepID=A0ABV0CZF5_9SPHN
MNTSSTSETRPRHRPPFRAEHVGSLLRSKELLKAREQAASGAITLKQLRALEDSEIARSVKRQEEIGLKVVTDGEMRRTSWHMDFLCEIDGVENAGTQVRSFENETGPVRNEITFPRITGNLSLSQTIFGDAFTFLQGVTTVTPKLSIPAPSILHGLGDTEFYDDEDQFFDDLITVYRAQIRKLEEIGCTYLQIDDTMLAMLADSSYVEKMRRVSSAPEKLALRYVDLLNRCIAERSEKLTVCVHTCRGNHRSAWTASGGYDPIAEATFSELQVDGLFLEFDDARSGSFEPLRYVPKDKHIVLGLLTSKKAELEEPQALARRIDEAARFIDLDQLCLSPQCGFASTSQGNLLTEDDQFAKLRLIVETAETVWGEA